MKQKIILACITSFLSLTLAAQYKKGEIMVGGNLNLYTDRYQSTLLKDFGSLHNTQIQLDGGIAIKNNLLLGGRVGFGRINGNTFYTNGRTSGFGANFYLSADVYLRKYIPLGKKISLFGEVSLSRTQGRYYSIGTDAVGGNFTANMKSRVMTLGGSAGLSYKVSDRVRLDLGVNNIISGRYAWTKGKRQYDNGTPSIPLTSAQFDGNMFNTTGLNISLGVKIRLGKK
jgi:hypothetical protein